MPIQIKKHFPIEVDQKNINRSSYTQTMARFEEILIGKLGVGSAVKMSFPSDAKIENKVASPFVETLENSGDSAGWIDKKLAGTPMAGLGKTFKAVENKTGVNAYVLASIAIHESTYGKSSIARDKANLFGFRAYDNNPYASAKAYASFDDGILDVAQYLKAEYLSPAGKHFKGYSLDAIGENYATDPEWSKKVKSVLQDIKK